MIEPAAIATAPTPHAEARDAEAAREDALLAALREATGVPTLEFDADRDVPLGYGEMPVLVRLVDEPPRVRIHSVALERGEIDAELLARLNELNALPGGMRWVATGRRVLAVVELPAAPLVAEHVAQALHAFCASCEVNARALRAEFGDGAIAMGRGASRLLH